MNVQEKLCQKKSSEKCKTCSVFYASEAYSGNCSSCYKKSQTQKKEEIIPKSPAETGTPNSLANSELAQVMEELSLEPAKKEQTDRKRCYDCNKKIGLLGVQCKCGYVYCNTHRLPEVHQCEFNHKAAGKQKLRKEIIKVYNGKIAEI